MAVMDFFKRWMEPAGATPATEDGGTDRRIQVAVCALMVEMARIDHVFTQDELQVLTEALSNRFGLSRDEIRALIADAESEPNDSVDLWHFAKTINDNLTIDEKVALVESLWRVVLVDGHMDEHEHYLMLKMKHLLRLDQQQINAAKSRARNPDPPDRTALNTPMSE